MLEIVDIDIKIDGNLFRDVIDDVMIKESNSFNETIDWSETMATLGRSGTPMCKIHIVNKDDSNTADIIAEQSGLDIYFKPIMLRNYNRSFYKFDYKSEKLEIVLLHLLKRLAIEAKGTIGMFNNDEKVLIKDGRDLTDHIKSLAIIDDRGRVYSLKASNIEDTENEGDESIGYIPTYLISEWLNDNLQFQTKIQGMPKTDQFELMAQFAVYQKRKNMLTADQFRDLLMQIGSFVDLVGGFKDESIKSIYQFFV